MLIVFGIITSTVEGMIVHMGFARTIVTWAGQLRRSGETPVADSLSSFGDQEGHPDGF